MPSPPPKQLQSTYSHRIAFAKSKVSEVINGETVKVIEDC